MDGPKGLLPGRICRKVEFLFWLFRPGLLLFSLSRQVSVLHRVRLCVTCYQLNFGARPETSQLICKVFSISYKIPEVSHPCVLGGRVNPNKSRPGVFRLLEIYSDARNSGLASDGLLYIWDREKLVLKRRLDRVCP